MVKELTKDKKEEALVALNLLIKLKEINFNYSDDEIVAFAITVHHLLNKDVSNIINSEKLEVN